MVKKRSAAESPRYRKFITARDQALEHFHMRAQAEIGDLMRHFLSRVAGIVALHALYGAKVSPKAATAGLDQAISNEIPGTVNLVAAAIARMRRNVWLLAHVGEAEAIGRTLGPDSGAKYQAPPVRVLQAQLAPNPMGGRWDARVELALLRIKQRVIDAAQLALVLEETPQELLARVQAALPKAGRYAAPPKELKRLREAAPLPKVEMASDASAGVVDEATWQAMLADYQTDYIPQWRGPETVFDLDVESHPVPGGGYQATATGAGQDLTEWYGWEVEQQLTQDFVEQVRDGQVTAAKENGITDFLWIAVLDAKTDECCAWRNGLTSNEISAELKNGQHRGDECRAIVPPAHFNCRCVLSPLLEGMPDEPPPDFGAFDEWLKT